MSIIKIAFLAYGKLPFHIFFNLIQMHFYKKQNIRTIHRRIYISGLFVTWIHHTFNKSQISPLLLTAEIIL